MTDQDPRTTNQQADLPAPETEPRDEELPRTDTESKLGKSMLIKVAFATVLVASLVISIANLMITNQLRDQTDEYQAEIKDYKEKISRLKYFINKEVDDEYVIEYAREYLDMYFPDEDIYYNDVNE